MVKALKQNMTLKATERERRGRARLRSTWKALISLMSLLVAETVVPQSRSSKKRKFL